MRSTRRLLLLAILVILGAVGATYYFQKRIQAQQAPAPPRPLPTDTDAALSDWVWRKDGDRTMIEVRARNFHQLSDPPRVDLDRVELRLFHKDGRRFDLIKSASAQFDLTQGTLFSDGQVEITTGLPMESTAPARLVSIRTSGLTFDSKSGGAFTDRPASFTFDRGDGKSVGASYDPAARELKMIAQVELHWKSQDPNAKPMKLEAGHLTYKENDSKIFLEPWAKLTRNTTTLESGNAIVSLRDGAIELVEATQAKGGDNAAARQIQYAAEQLRMEFTPNGEVRNILGEGKATLAALSDSSRTTMTSHRVDLDFDAGKNESTLRKALARGNSAVEAMPLPRRGVPTPETKLIRSEVIEFIMRAGGREIEQVRTHEPGYVEFLPNSTGQRRRRLDGERMTFTYGPNNRLQAFRATTVKTRTEPDPRRKSKAAAAPIETWSKELSAAFDPKSGRMTRMEQWDDFRYEEGERRATAEKAILDQSANSITLERAARAWDPSGSISGNRIVIDQKTGNVNAVGNVVSNRLPERKAKSSAMLSDDNPMDARAERMFATDNNRIIRYEGNATVWQGSNRIRAEVIDINREVGRLIARERVKTQFLDTQKNGKGKNPDSQTGPRRAPGFVIVESAELVYTDGERLAHYKGGAHLQRAGMNVRAAEIRAYLNDSSAASSLNRAYADGKVEIIRSDGERNLKGTADHAEYYAADERIFLHGGEPTLIDSAKGSTKGNELTYYAGNDKLLVNGAAEQPVKTRIRRP